MTPLNAAIYAATADVMDAVLDALRLEPGIAQYNLEEVLAPARASVEWRLCELANEILRIPRIPRDISRCTAPILSWL
jgi:hypothetical protein